VFCRWARDRRFTAAASRTVAALEKRIGVALLVRTTRAVMLTEAGSDYLFVDSTIVRAHPRWTFYFTPTSAGWLNAVEGFFAVLTKRPSSAESSRASSITTRSQSPSSGPPTQTKSSPLLPEGPKCWIQSTRTGTRPPSWRSITSSSEVRRTTGQRRPDCGRCPSMLLQ
jgi:hypothetical protein